jgi:integrase
MKVTSEGPLRITKATIDGAWRRRATDARLVVRDRDCRGLALIVNPTGMTWTYAYRPRGTDPLTNRRWPNKTVTLGNPASLSIDEARQEANRIKGQAAAGADPAAEKKARAAEDRKRRGATLSRLLDDYGKALPTRPKMRGNGKPSPDYVAEELAQTGFALVEMGAKDKPVADLTEADVRGLLAKAEGKTTARKRFGPLSRFLDWCKDAGYIQTNPCDLITRARRPRAPQSRAHYLKPDELARLWKAADALDEPVWRDIVRFLIAVPCRRSEATEMEWSHLDLKAGTWSQPGKMTKNGEPHRLLLHPLAMEVLAERRQAQALAQAEGDAREAARIIGAGPPRAGLVFPSPLAGKTIDTFTDIKASLTKATKPKEDPYGAELAGWTWHDFRRSFVTALADAGVSETVADAMLNHRQSATRGGVLGVYQRSSRWPEQVKAMELWGRLLTAALQGGEADAKVVPMVARAG